VPRFQPERIFETLAKHGVDYVLIGGLAATLHGSNLRTGDADICPSRAKSNLDRLASALVEMQARVRAPDASNGLRFQCDAKFLAQMDICNLSTRFGDFDISFKPAGTSGYGDLRKNSVIYDLATVQVPTASLEDVIRSKEAAARPKDLGQLPTLRSLLEETKRIRPLRTRQHESKPKDRR
jgi:hypothetical protein